MRIEHWGGLEVRIAGGTDRMGGGDGPVVVLMHGFGAAGDDLVPLHRVVDLGREVRFVFPAAPHPLPPHYGAMGRAWWQLDLDRVERAMAAGVPRDLAEDDPDGLEEARGRVRAMLREARTELGAEDAPLVLGGFSQGAMLACDVAFRSDERIDALVVLSGALLAQRAWTTRMAARAGMPVFQSHGSSDTLLSFGGAEALKAKMEKAGLVVDWTPFRGGHEIPPTVMGRLEAFLGRVLRVEPR
jgi:phospholipase/carboxylesterase